MYSYQAETVRPDYFDEFFGQVTRITEVTYRCGWCNLPSNDFWNVNQIYWSKYPQTKFCGTRCADKWANNMYEKGITPISYANYERHDYELDARVKKAWDMWDKITKDDQLEIAFWLRNLFIQYNASFEHAGKEWQVHGYDSKYYKSFIEKLQRGEAFDLSTEAKLIEFNNSLSGVLSWNDISLREEIRQEYRMRNELHECGCPVNLPEGHQEGCAVIEMSNK